MVRVAGKEGGGGGGGVNELELYDMELLGDITCLVVFITLADLTEGEAAGEGGSRSTVAPPTLFNEIAGFETILRPYLLHHGAPCDPDVIGR